MTLEEARVVLKQNAKVAVEIYRTYSELGFGYESPIALARDVIFSVSLVIVPPPEDEWDIPF